MPVRAQGHNVILLGYQRCFPVPHSQFTSTSPGDNSAVSSPAASCLGFVHDHTSSASAFTR